MKGEKIKELIKKGAFIKVVNRPDKKHEKSVLEFRLFINENTFYTITKYQSFSFLSDEQKKLVEFYEHVKKNIVEAPFNVRLAWNSEIVKGREKNSLSTKQFREIIMHQAITKKEYLELE